MRSFPRVGVVVHVHPDHFAGVLPLGRHEVEVRLELVAGTTGLLLLVVRRWRSVRRPVGRPVRVVAVVVRWLLRGHGQRVRAGGPVVVVRGWRWWTVVHVPAAATVGRRRWPVQRPRLGVMVTAATSVVRYQLRGQRYGGRVTQRTGRLFLVTVVLVERVVRVRTSAAGRIILPRGIHASVILRTHNTIVRQGLYDLLIYV